MEEKGKKEVGNVLMTDYYPLNFIRIFFFVSQRSEQKIFLWFMELEVYQRNGIGR